MKKLPIFDESIALSLSTWVEIMKAFTKIRSLELELIEKNNLTIGQFSVLELLFHRGDQTIGAATKLAMSTPGNMTVIVKNLIKCGLITSHKDVLDKRITILSITKEGASIMEKIFPIHAYKIQQFFEGLSSPDQQILKTLLRKLNKSLR